MESNNIDPDTCGDEPLSITANPPNLTDGFNALTVIILSEILTIDELICCIDDEPATIKSWETYNDPVIV
jgi:hypothetical protein